MVSNEFTADVDIEIIPAAWHKLGEWYGSGIVSKGTATKGNIVTDIGKIYIRHTCTDDTNHQKFNFIGEGELTVNV
jgi:hypothetical protein